MPCISAQTGLYCLMRSSVTTVGKRGREISPSCFCHSQLILSCPPPLYSSSFLAAHRIWPGPLCFQQWCFLDRAIRPCQNARYPLRTIPPLLLLPSLSLRYLRSLPSVSVDHKQCILTFKKKHCVAWMYLEGFSLSVATGCVVTERGVSV